MSWVRIDDSFPEHIKVAPLSDAAFRAYVSSVCYAARNLTDGFVPLKKAKEFAGKARVFQELMPDLWQATEGGVIIHDYLDYNPKRADVLDKRAKDLARKTGGFRAESKRPDPHPLPDPLPRDPDPSPTPLPPSAAEVLAARPNIYVRYERLFGKGPSPYNAQRLREYEQELEPQCVDHCFDQAADKDARTPGYLFSILERHAKEGCDDNRPSRSTQNGAGANPDPGFIARQAEHEATRVKRDFRP